MGLVAQQLAMAMPGNKPNSRANVEMEPRWHYKMSGTEDSTATLPLPIAQVARPSNTRHQSTVTSTKTTIVQASLELEAAGIEASIEPNATHRVLGTTELLEMILLELPVTTLFAIQRVNTRFRDTITGSIRLRRAMFLQTDPFFEANDKQQINPILEQCTFTPKPGLHLEIISSNNTSLYRELTDYVNFDVPYFTTPTSKRTRTRDKVWLGHVHEPSKPLKLPHRTDVRESWQYMLFKQGRPAKTSVRLWYHIGKGVKPLDYAREKLRRRTNMGKVWEFIETMH